MINDLFGEKRKHILIVDFSAINVAVFHAIKTDPKLKDQEDLLNFWRHTLLNSVLTKKDIIKPDNVILTIDSHSWRNEFFQYYKARRKLEKAKSDVDYEFFYKASDQLIEEMKVHFPWLIIKQHGAEADDIVAILSIELSKENDVTILSSDKDLLNLTINKNVKFYSYRDDQYKTLDNPRETILRHIINGDSGDGVPNLLSDDNVFVSEKRQKGCGPVKQDKILEQGIEEFIKENKLEENWKRNKTLIELSSETIPENIWNSVLTSYIEYIKVKPDFTTIIKFLHKNGLIQLQNKIHQFF